MPKQMQDSALNTAFVHAILDSISSMIAVIDRNGVIIDVNNSWRRFSIENGIEPNQPAPRTDIGVNYLEICRSCAGPSTEGALNAYQGIRAVLNGTLPSFSIEYPCHSPTRRRWFIMTATPLNIGSGGAVIAHVDITERVLAEESQRLFASVFNHASESITITDASHNIVEVNAAFVRDTGYAREEVIGKNPRILQSGVQSADFYVSMWESLKTHEYWKGEIWNRNKAGELYAVLLAISAVKSQDGEITHYIGISSNITHLKNRQSELEYAAHHDALTGLPNRTLLADRIKQAMAHAKRTGTLLGICYLDLDGFKPVNDQIGHDAGDFVLVEISRRIKNTLRNSDTVARLGGDEFAILLPGLENAEEYRLTMDRVLEAIARPLTLKNRSVTLSASIGVCLFPSYSEDIQTLLSWADQAMNAAKRKGKNQHQLYSDASAHDEIESSS